MKCATARTRVVKKLGPRQPGALGWARQYGDALVCVRYRLDAEGERRYTTVELVVDAAPMSRRTDNSKVVAVRIGYGEKALRQKAMPAGAQWDANSRVWRLTRNKAEALGLLDRVVD